MCHRSFHPSIIFESSCFRTPILRWEFDPICNEDTPCRLAVPAKRSPDECASRGKEVLIRNSVNFFSIFMFLSPNKS